MSVIGIRQAFACQKNSLGNSHQYPVFMGIGDQGKLEISDAIVKGYNEEDLPQYVNHKASWRSFQISLFDLAYLQLIYAAQDGADVEIVTEKIGTAYSGVWKFAGGNKFMGVDWTYMESMKERYIEFIGEVALPLEDHKTLLQAAVTNLPTNIPAAFPGKTDRGRSEALYQTPFFGSVNSPAGSVICNDFELVDYKHIIKTVTEKIAYNRSKTNWLQIMVELTINRTQAWQLLDYFNRKRDAAVVLVTKYKDGSSITYTYPEGVLFRKQDYVQDKQNANIKLTFTRNIPVADLAVNAYTKQVAVSTAV